MLTLLVLFVARWLPLSFHDKLNESDNTTGQLFGFTILMDAMNMAIGYLLHQ